MLHVFNVNRGRMLTFDVNLAMERVLDLKNVISTDFAIAAEKQVMLISGGQALCDDERVCSYAAGTETNPVYLFDKACIEKETLQLESSYHAGNDFSESIRNACILPPTFNTVDVRTKLAMRLHEATRDRVASMRSLVHDEHLMFQGWKAAVANLFETVNGFQNRVAAMCEKCQRLFKQGMHNKDVLNGLDQVLENLREIPLLPALVNKGGKLNSNSGTDQFQVSLLHWIKSQCKNVSLQTMYNECKQKQEYLSQDHYSSLIEECRKVDSQTANTHMSEISGLTERLAALDHMIVDAEQKGKDQTGIAQGFVRNRETARELQNTSPSIDALLTLCESHKNQLQIMSKYESMTRDALRKCIHAKNELAANLHARLRWLYFVQRGILNADVKLSMFVQQLGLLQKQVGFLQQVKNCPSLYLASVAEVVRRKNFANAYVLWANKAVADARVERDREIVKRKTYQSNMAGHFIQRLFHGLSDKPPSLSKKPLRTFDNNLPDITTEHISMLSQILPSFKDILEIQSQSINTSTSTTSSAQQSDSTTTATQSTQSIETIATSSLTDDSVSEKRDRSTTRSYAMVDHTTISHSKPGGFVVTSVENVTQANLAENLENQAKIENDVFHRNQQDNLPQREYSPSLSDNQQTPPLSSLDGPDSMFARIDDIISPDSPPDSEFFSIMPGSFGHNQSDAGPSSLDAELSTPQRSVSTNKKQISRSRSSRKQSFDHVGSLDSNSSTSYQKVDGLSSDEEMFHSFTSDHQDLKAIRKKLHQLQSDYDILNEDSKLEKDELNTLVRKLKGEISALEESHIRTSDYEKRWDESKMELENVIKQLENERVERKKAWNEGANLEKKLKTFQEEYQSHFAQIETLKKELSTKNETVSMLQNALRETEHNAATGMAEAEQKVNDIINTKETEFQRELEISKTTSAKWERDLSFARTELSTAEDRIQDLETALSDYERKQEDDTVQFHAFESRIQELSSKLECTSESYQKSTNERNETEQRLSEAESKLAKANEQNASIKKLLVDYETRLNDDRVKDDLIRSLKATQHQSDLDKTELTANLEASSKEIERLRNIVEKSETDTQSLRSIAMQDQASHVDELEKIKSLHQKELESVSCRLDSDVQHLLQKHKEEVDAMISKYEKALQEKDEIWRSREVEIQTENRNELDEIEADRLASIAQAQQAVEEMRERLRDSNRALEIERKESATVKESLIENHQKLEKAHSRACLENSELQSKNSDLEEELVQCKDEIRNLQEQNTAAANRLQSSILTSSTDEEMESKRTKIDPGCSGAMEVSTSNMERSSSVDSNMTNQMTMSVHDHKKAISIIKNNYDEDKKSLQNFFKKREEESARRRQMVFNSAIQRITTNKDMEIGKLKEKLMAQSQINPTVTQSLHVPGSQSMTSSMSQSPPSLPSSSSFVGAQASGRSESPSSDRSREKDKAAVTNFQIGDTVLVCFNETYQHFTLLTTSRMLHFVHTESLEKLGISAANPESKKSMTFATLREKEYCQARKAQNRFKVPINTKFYRVKVSPLSKRNAPS